MTRLAILAPRSFQADVIETLHDARAAHIEKFTGSSEDDLHIGDPLPEGSHASKLLVRIRGLLHTLGLEESTPTQRLSRATIENRLESDFEDIAAEVEDVEKTLSRLRRERDDLKEQARTLEPFQALPLDLEDYHGYDSLEVLIGTAEPSIKRTIEENLERFESFHGEDVHAVFVANDEAEEAQEVLTRHGFNPVELPSGEGDIAQRIQQLESRLDEVRERIQEAKSQKDALADKHRDLLLCAEEEFSIVVEKAEAPLDFASTERTFIVDAWVPSDVLEDLRSTLDEATRGRVHIEKLDEGERHDEGREKQPPTQYRHSDSVQPFSFLTDVFGTPRYGEVDPTIILALVFPLFLGFIIGDLGYGILMMGLGLYLYRSFKDQNEALGSLGFALLIAGAWAALFGGLVFKDFLGLAFYSGAHPPNWETLGVADGLGKPIISKLTADSSHAAYWGVPEMLALSVVAAFVHLFIGFVFAFVNHLHHNTKHAIAQIGWMVVLTGFLVLIAAQSPPNAVSDWLHGLAGNASPQTALYVVGAGVLVLLVTEGLFGLMETVSLLSHIISYTRLAAVGVAKAGILVAFTQILIVDIALSSGYGTGVSILLFVVGLVFFTAIQVTMFALGLLSGSIQSIRLNYVEFFLKFFEGGGDRFEPFGRSRRFTVESNKPTEVQR